MCRTNEKQCVKRNCPWCHTSIAPLAPLHICGMIENFPETTCVWVSDVGTRLLVFLVSEDERSFALRVTSRYSDNRGTLLHETFEQVHSL
jgi:hypothetical protein